MSTKSQDVMDCTQRKMAGLGETGTDILIMQICFGLRREPAG